MAIVKAPVETEEERLARLAREAAAAGGASGGAPAPAPSTTPSTAGAPAQAPPPPPVPEPAPKPPPTPGVTPTAAPATAPAEMPDYGAESLAENETSWQSKMKDIQDVGAYQQRLASNLGAASGRSIGGGLAGLMLQGQADTAGYANQAAQMNQQQRLGIMAQRAASKQGEWNRIQGQKFQTSEREATQAYGTGERVGTQDFTAGESVKQRDWTSIEAGFDRDLTAKLKGLDITEAQRAQAATILANTNLQDDQQAAVLELTKLGFDQETAMEMARQTFTASENTFDRKHAKELTELGITSDQKMQLTQIMANTALQDDAQAMQAELQKAGFTQEQTMAILGFAQQDKTVASGQAFEEKMLKLNNQFSTDLANLGITAERTNLVLRLASDATLAGDANALALELQKNGIDAETAAKVAQWAQDEKVHNALLEEESAREGGGGPTLGGELPEPGSQASIDSATQLPEFGELINAPGYSSMANSAISSIAGVDPVQFAADFVNAQYVKTGVMPTPDEANQALVKHLASLVNDSQEINDAVYQPAGPPNTDFVELENIKKKNWPAIKAAGLSPTDPRLNDLLGQGFNIEQAIIQIQIGG